MSFSRKTIEFLIENRLRNDKVWFNANRAAFDDVVMNPLRSLAVSLAPAALQVDAQMITDAKVGKTLSRVFRDTRFSRDKSLFRDVMWIVYMRDRNINYNPPALVFEISPQGFRCGCGYYQMEPKQMSVLRELMNNDDKTYLAAKKTFLNQSRFGIEGESFAKVRYPHSDAFTQNLLNRKNICFIYTSTDFDLLYSPDLYKTLAADFNMLEPYYELFKKSCKIIQENEIHGI